MKTGARRILLVGLCSAMVVGAVISCSTDKSTDTSDKIMDSTITDQLDSIVDAAVNSTGIPGAMVGIWGPDGNYVKVAGVFFIYYNATMDIYL